MKRNRVLIVDDRDENLCLLRTLLQGHGYKVDEARHGAEALERARQSPPDLIISDILMPVMDGFALCREWKKDGLLNPIPFVFYTATYTDERDRQFALNLGAERFIVKPEEPDAFIAAIQETLQQAEGEPTAQGRPPAENEKTEGEAAYLKQYNEALFRKLEDKMAQLEQANDKLKQELDERTRAEEEREKLRAQLAQSQKLESIGRLAGGVAHDFNNMLQVILGCTDMALDKTDPATPLHADLTEVRKAAQRSADLTRQLLTFARKQVITPKVLNLNATIEGMLKMLKRIIGEDIDLVWRPGAELWAVKVDESQIDQIMVNLCVNARHAIAAVGKITIETGNAMLDEPYCSAYKDATPGNYVLLAVSDNGCGMGKKVMEHLFEPFFTTKKRGSGTGLGLATVYGIVKQNNGYINVYSEEKKGTTFKIYLPRHSEKAPMPQANVREQPPRQGPGRGTILLVEDDPKILHMVQKMLEDMGYAVLTAKTPDEAIRQAAHHIGEIHLLLTDLIMPKMSGIDLAQQLLAPAPSLKCLFMSGYTANVITCRGMSNVGINFIQKPFSSKALADKVRELLESRSDGKPRADGGTRPETPPLA